MNVKLISITQPIINDIKNPEDLIVYCARVSNPSNQLNLETAPKLIKYCIDHKHWSIFEMVDMCVEIQTSRAIGSQILRHKSASFQEFSQRYASVQTFEDIELRKQGKTNRQVGDEEIEDEQLKVEINTILSQTNKLYHKMIDGGIARECARMILPMTTQTTMYMKNNVRNWIHYIDLRTKPDTQKEHRNIALAIKEIFIENFPNISQSLSWIDS